MANIYEHNLTETKALASTDWHRILEDIGGGTLESRRVLSSNFLPLSASGHLYGLTLSNNAGDATNDIDIAAGNCADSTNVTLLTLASALTKRLDAAWAVGTNQGGLDTGAIANATYHIWLIKRSDTGVVDALFSASASTPTMPANYDYKRRIGSVVRTGGAIKAFIQDGDLFMWLVPVADVSVVNPGTSAVTRTLTLPTGIRVKALLSVAGLSSVGAADNPQGIYISDLSVTDSVPSISLMSFYCYNGGAVANQVGGQAAVMTNTSAQVRSRLQVSTANTGLYISTNGWEDSRGRLA